MDPKKARNLTILIALTALVIIGICLCMLFNVKLLPEEEAELTPTPEPTETAVATVEEPERSPGPADLHGCSDDMYRPKEESYLPQYVSMITYAQESKTVSLQYRPEKKEFSRHVIVELEDQTPVIAIAQENGYTLVLVKEGLGGWIITQELQYY